MEKYKIDKYKFKNNFNIDIKTTNKKYTYKILKYKYINKQYGNGKDENIKYPEKIYIINLHGILTMDEFIIPDNCYILLPLCCGMVNYFGTYEIEYILNMKNSEIHNGIYKAKDKVDSYLYNPYVIFNPGDTICDISLSGLESDFFAINQFSLGIIDNEYMVPHLNEFIADYDYLQKYGELLKLLTDEKYKEFIKILLRYINISKKEIKTFCEYICGTKEEYDKRYYQRRDEREYFFIENMDYMCGTYMNFDDDIFTAIMDIYDSIIYLDNDMLDEKKKKLLKKYSMGNIFLKEFIIIQLSLIQLNLKQLR